MKSFRRLSAQGALASAFLFASLAAYAGPVIKSVLTAHSVGGVPTSITIFGTGLCAASNCSTKPTVTLGGVALTGITGTATGISAKVGALADGDYLLTLKAGTSTVNYHFTLRSLTTGGGNTTVSVGTTTTGASGSSASVSNSGTSTDAVLNFTIPTGAQGPAGAPGIPGPMGLPGAPGIQGPVGPSGPGGPMGLQGPAGADGTQGPAGPAGAKGDKGDRGDTGAAGNDGQGLAFKGAWLAESTYAPLDVVTQEGSSFIAVAPSTGVSPSNDVAGDGGSWAMLAAKGAEGPQGPAGTDGAAGAIGPQGPAGADGAPGRDGSDGLPGLPGIPGAQGPEGAEGPAGPQGPTGPQGEPGPPGDTGPMGPQGPTGVEHGVAFGELLFWDGAKWARLAPPATNDVALRYCNGAPMWVSACPEFPIVEDFTDGIFNTSALFEPNDGPGMFELLPDGLHRTAGTEAYNRMWLRTIDTGYLRRDFTFEISFTVTAGATWDLPFIGFGEAQPNGIYFYDQKNSFQVRIKIGPNGVEWADVMVNSEGDEAYTRRGVPFSFPATPLPADYTLRIVKSGNQATFTISGGGATFTDTIPDIAAVAPFLNNTNTRIFFGGVYPSTAYKSLSITSP